MPRFETHEAKYIQCFKECPVCGGELDTKITMTDKGPKTYYSTITIGGKAFPSCKRCFLVVYGTAGFVFRVYWFFIRIWRRIKRR